MRFHLKRCYPKIAAAFFIMPGLLFGAREIFVAFTPGSNQFSTNGLASWIECSIVNPSTESQNVNVTAIELGNIGHAGGEGSFFIENTNTTELSNDSVELSTNESIHLIWRTAVGGNGVGIPKSIKITVTEDTGFLTGQCLHHYFKSPNLAANIGISINGGRPF